MTFMLVAIIFVAVVGGVILLMVLRATAGSTPASPEPGDPTPVGDTQHHSRAEGRAPERPGPVEPGSGRFKRDPVGGEAEGEAVIKTDRR